MRYMKLHRNFDLLLCSPLDMMCEDLLNVYISDAPIRGPPLQIAYN